MDTNVKAENFHPMRGDVYDGCRILLKTGDILTLKSSGGAISYCWKVVDKNNNIIIKSDSAYDLTSQIYYYDVNL
jgi:hypothetical protein